MKQNYLPAWAWVGALILGIAVGLLRAWAAIVMWGWYVVPLGAPRIGVAVAWGLGFLVGVLNIQPPAKPLQQLGGGDGEVAKVMAPFITSIFIILAYLGAGWVIQAVML